MDIEEVINILLDEGGIRGRTASPGSSYYQRARGLEFVRCECSHRARTPAMPGYDYIARTARGAYLYVGINSRSRIVSCGPKGFHKLNGTRPCI